MSLSYRIIECKTRERSLKSAIQRVFVQNGHSWISVTKPIAPSYRRKTNFMYQLEYYFFAVSWAFDIFWNCRFIKKESIILEDKIYNFHFSGKKKLSPDALFQFERPRRYRPVIVIVGVFVQLLPDVAIYIYI